MYGGAHLAVMDPSKIPIDKLWRYQVTVMMNNPENGITVSQGANTTAAPTAANNVVVVTTASDLNPCRLLY